MENIKTVECGLLHTRKLCGMIAATAIEGGAKRLGVGTVAFDDLRKLCLQLEDLAVLRVRCRVEIRAVDTGPTRLSVVHVALAAELQLHALVQIARRGAAHGILATKRGAIATLVGQGHIAVDALGK